MRLQLLPFNPLSSKSFTNLNFPVSITYEIGSVQGVACSDTVSMGGFTVQTQTFVSATHIEQVLPFNGDSGLLGLAFKSIALTMAAPFVEALVDQNKLSSPLISIYLARFGNDTVASVVEPEGGTLTLGTTNNTSYTGDIDYVNIPSSVTPGFWLLPLTELIVQGAPVTSGLGASTLTPLAAIDTGTSFIFGPREGVAAVYANIPGSQRGVGFQAGFWSVPRDTKVNVTLSFGGTRSWTIDPTDFTVSPQGQPGCFGAILELPSPPPPTGPGQPTNPDWILGDTFMKNVYSVFRFNPPSVGFAQPAPRTPATTPTSSGAASFPSQSSPSPTHSPNLNGASSLDLPIVSLAWAFGLIGVVSRIMCTL